MSIASCPVSGVAGSQCPAGSIAGRSRSSSRIGPRGCSFSGYTQPGDIHAAFDVGWHGPYLILGPELTMPDPERSRPRRLVANEVGLAEPGVLAASTQADFSRERKAINEILYANIP